MVKKSTMIAKCLREAIATGEFSDRLPSELELGKRYSVATMTIRQSLDVLVESDLIEKVPNVGTFVKKSRSEARIYWPGDNPMALWGDSIPGIIKDMVPDCRVVFDDNLITDEVRPWPSDYDLVVSPATSRIPYGDHVRAISESVINEFGSDRYFTDLFAVHSVGKTCYGLPILYSPALLLFNSSLCPEFKIANPVDFGFNELSEILKLTRKQGVKLFTASTAKLLFHYLVFCASDKLGRVASIDTRRLTTLLTKFKPFFNKKVFHSDPGAFDKGEVVATAIFRQNHNYDLGSDEYILLPFPNEVGGKAIAGGEFLLLSNSNENKHESLKVAKAFLSERVQRVIADNHIGLPMMKSMAVESLNSLKYRDDLFFTMSRNLLLNNASEQDFILRQGLFFQDWLTENITYDKLIELTVREIEMSKIITIEKRGAYASPLI